MAIRNPFLSLQPDEVQYTSDAVRAKHPGKSIIFRTIGIKEPSKSESVAFLQQQGEAPARRTYVCYQIKGEPTVFEEIVDLTNGNTFQSRNLGGTCYPPATNVDMHRLESIVMNDSRVQAEIARLKLPEGAVVQPEPWPYGVDSSTPERRQYQVWMFLKSLDPKAQEHPSSNHFAHPLDFSAVVDDLTMQVVRIDRLPMNPNELVCDEKTAAERPWQPNPDAEYASELQPKLRDDLKPIHITQPEGVSFKVSDDEVVEWQKWRFHLDFNWREGVVIRNVTYDGRPVFYRLSLAEMTVPYGDPRDPYHRKSAYDLGEGGVGATSNNLQLGCDCLGAIRYFDRWTNDHEGKPVMLENAICMHEVDGGIGWKHSNYRTGRAEVTRSRELVIQTIMTISNYEYILQWVFDTAANIHYEARATGIMSLVPADQNGDQDYHYGIMVSPGVMAPIHQHIFCLRLDPAIDSYNEGAIVYEDVKRVNWTKETDPYGVAFGVFQNQIEKESYLDLDPSLNRVVKMINPKRKNKASNKPTGYKVMVAPTQLQLAEVGSMHHKRAEFADHHFYFTKGTENELFPAGDFPWQGVGGDGLRTWASREGAIGAGEGVVWCTFAFTHVPRPEDWPVMPCEVFRVGLKPVNFFEKNPALDVPPSKQGVNQSVEITRSQKENDLRKGHCCNGHT
ncbi:copper amine oxidase [Bisporella sp. PMI_857]|nr:copper amine oxidase [Bisporella sp. PMI_857]